MLPRLHRFLEIVPHDVSRVIQRVPKFALKPGLIDQLGDFGQDRNELDVSQRQPIRLPGIIPLGTYILIGMRRTHLQASHPSKPASHSMRRTP